MTKAELHASLQTALQNERCAFNSPESRAAVKKELFDDNESVSYPRLVGWIITNSVEINLRVLENVLGDILELDD